MIIITKKLKTIYDLVFNFGYDESELSDLSYKELRSLKLSLMIAEKTATFNGHKPLKLACGKLNKHN